MNNPAKNIATYFNKHKASAIVALIAFAHWFITFFTDRFIFIDIPGEKPYDYIVCKIILLFLLYLIYYTVYTLIFSPDREKFAAFHIMKYALIYLIPIIAVLIFKLPEGFLSNDEALIFEAAQNLEHYTWFYYITVYYYIISMMLIPLWISPIILKVVLQLLICGYCVYRLNKYLGGKYAWILYLAFLLPPVLAYTTSAHRLPIYFLLYLLLFYILMMDFIEQVALTPAKALFLMVTSAILTQWRTEGIYLLALIPILLFIVYKNIHTKKLFISLLLIYFAVQYLISIPQNGIFPDRLGDQADNRMGPFYAYTITNMYRNGLDTEKNAEDLVIVDKFLSLDAIESINEYYEDINYEDVLILYKEGFIGQRPEATGEDYANYADALKRIFIKNPNVLLKTRWGSFCYAATPYDIMFSGMGVRPLINFAISIIKTLAYNLFIPHLIVLLLFIYSIIKKRVYTFFFSSGLIAHWFIVFVLAPASYFKYYFPIYIMAYLYVILIFIQFIYNRYHGDKKIDFLI